MDLPAVFDPRGLADDVVLIPSFVPVPGLGVLAVNCCVIKSHEPVLVDMGVVAMGRAYFGAITKVVDPSDLRFIWLTHTDPDHVGCLEELLEAAPQARIVTNFLGMAKLGLRNPLPPERFYLINPGQSLDVGDRELLALRPPIVDAPETMGLFDGKTRTLLSADCFGGVVQAPTDSAEAIPDEELTAGVRLWATVDAPWLPLVDASAFGRALKAISDLKPSLLVSSHLAPATRHVDRLLGQLDAARTTPPFVGPDQAAFAGMMAQ
jgi:flavorubredoxin